eukprot:scaffold11.g3964.t1
MVSRAASGAGGGASASPLPQSVVKNIGDKASVLQEGAAGRGPLGQRGGHLYERRKAAALEVERIVGAAPGSVGPIADALVEYTRSANPNYRKGGLLCLAATAVGLAGAAEAGSGGGDRSPPSAPGGAAPAPALPPELLAKLLAPVLDALRDPDSRTRFYALEARGNAPPDCLALYNIMRASRVSGSLMPQFPQVLAALFAVYGDASPDVQNAAAVLDNLLKARSLCKLTLRPRRFVLSWLSFLETLPGSEELLVEHLHELLPGLLGMLGSSEEHPEIRQAVVGGGAHTSSRVDLPQLASILVDCLAQPDQPDAAALTCLRWLHELVAMAPAQARACALVPYYAPMLDAVLPRRGSAAPVIASAATTLLQQVRAQLQALAEREAAAPGGGAAAGLPTRAVLGAAARALEAPGEGEAVKLEALQLLQLLLAADGALVAAADGALLGALLEALQSASDRVVGEALGVLCSVAGSGRERFTQVMRSLLDGFRGGSGARLLQQRGMQVVQHLCSQLGPHKVFVQLSALLAAEEDQGFLLALVQALNLILMTSGPLLGLRDRLRSQRGGGGGGGGEKGEGEGDDLFGALCAPRLRARRRPSLRRRAAAPAEDELAWELVRTLGSREPSLQDTLELTQLVALLEAPCFAGMRMRLLAPGEHPHLLRALGGLLMLLPQADAFRTLQARLAVAPQLGSSPAAAAAHAVGSGGGSGGGGGAAPSSSSSAARRAERLALFRQRRGAS